MADEGGVRKLTFLVRSFGAESDVLFDPSIIAVRPLDDPRCHTYFADHGPAVLERLFLETGIHRLEAPLVAHAPAHDRALRPTRTRAPASVLWFLPLARGVELRSRAVPPGGPPPKPMAVPAEGPWALPPAWTLPAFARAPEVYVDGSGFACPHCRREEPRYRAIAAGCFVCQGCGRSFTSPALAARLEAR